MHCINRGFSWSNFEKKTVSQEWEGWLTLNKGIWVGRCSPWTWPFGNQGEVHYSDVIMGAMASQITIVYSTVYSGAHKRKHRNSASLAFVWWNSPVTCEFTAQMASNAENVSIWWRHLGSDLPDSDRIDMGLCVSVEEDLVSIRNHLMDQNNNNFFIVPQ